MERHIESVQPKTCEGAERQCEEKPSTWGALAFKCDSVEAAIKLSADQIRCSEVKSSDCPNMPRAEEIRIHCALAWHYTSHEIRSPTNFMNQLGAAIGRVDRQAMEEINQNCCDDDFLQN
jgi:hypothetical protein